MSTSTPGAQCLGRDCHCGNAASGRSPASNGGLNISGGVVTVGNSMILGAGASSNGTLNLGGGTPLAGTLVTPGLGQGSGSGTVNFNGGLLQASAGNASFLTGLTSANILAGGAYINDGGFSITIGQSLQSGTSPAPDGGLTKSGAGTVTLTGSNAYTGTTTVNAGNLVLNFAAATAPPSNIVNFASNSSSLTFGGGASLVVQGAAGANNSQQFNGLTVNSGSGVATIAVNSGAGGAASLSLGDRRLHERFYGLLPALQRRHHDDQRQRPSRCLGDRFGGWFCPGQRRNRHRPARQRLC